MSGADQWNENEEFGDLIDLLREGPIDLTDDKPGASVWAGISDELGLSADGVQWGASAADRSSATASSEPLGQRSFAVEDAAASAGTSGKAENVVSLASRRPGWGRPAAILTLAAAVVLLLAVPVGLSLRGGDDAELIASADLALLEGQVGSEVSAELVSIDGDLVLDVVAPTDVAEGEFLELWLLEVGDDVEALESLGMIDGSGRYDVPDDIDLERFTVVDISIEADDGNPDHSGNSVVRGELA